MIVLSSVCEMQEMAESARREGKRIGLVPTMGYLHEGHLSLIRRAKTECDVVVTTIFVNPTQFGPHEDFSRYPRDLERDTRLAASAGTDMLCTPLAEEIYPLGYRSFIDVEVIASMLEGKSRPTHFRGVATIVAKLFNIVRPHVAVFGQKDYQQAVVIRQMAMDLNFDLDIIVAPIVRESDGLALSSRNVLLTVPERAQAVVLSQSLCEAEHLIAAGEQSASVILGKMRQLIVKQPLATIDYLSIADSASLEEQSVLKAGASLLVSLAVTFGSTRLIDNTVVIVP